MDEQRSKDKEEFQKKDAYAQLLDEQLKNAAIEKHELQNQIQSKDEELAQISPMKAKIDRKRARVHENKEALKV